ncbi:MAG TPA: glutathione peroxidase [Candidatus Tumulicola sp.]|jgi:glutathione peroxidase
MTDLQQIPLTTIDGKAANLGDYAGKVLLVVNTASKCGLTPQYEGLTALSARFRDAGLVVLGFPTNDFAGQEPGTDEEIATFCSTAYGVNFPMFSKIGIVGQSKHPLYAELIAQQPKATRSEAFREELKGYGMTPNPEPEVLWNFEKFLVGRDGKAVERFSPDVAPEDELLIGAIERELQV